MRTNNSIQNILMNYKQLTNNTDKYTHSVVYKLSCPDGSKAYVGEMGKKFFLTRFNENKAAFRANNQNSNYAKHLTEHTPFWPHSRHYADTTMPEQRSTPQYHRTLLHIQRVYKKQSLKWRTHYIPQQDLWCSAHTRPTVIPHPPPPPPQKGHTTEPRPRRWFKYPHEVHAFRYSASYK